MLQSKLASTAKLVGSFSAGFYIYQKTVGNTVKNAIRESGILNNYTLNNNNNNNNNSNNNNVLSIERYDNELINDNETKSTTTLNILPSSSSSSSPTTTTKDENNDINIDNDNYYYYEDNNNLLLTNNYEKNENDNHIYNSVQNITSNRELMASLLQEHVAAITNERLDVICDVVTKCFQDDELMSVIRKKIQKFPTNSLPSAIPVPNTTTSLTPSDLTDEWAKLIGTHKCCMCLDLLAAPCITNCGHSFCGECITTHINRCITLESGLDIVVIQCPMCRHEISGEPTFERVLDEDIANQVKSFPDCPEKRDWSFRRETFKTKLMLKNDKKTNKKSKEFPQLDDDEMDTIQAVAVVVIICLIMSAAGTVFTHIHKK